MLIFMAVTNLGPAGVADSAELGVIEHNPLFL